jgi:hypothetical protein
MENQWGLGLAKGARLPQLGEKLQIPAGRGTTFSVPHYEALTLLGLGVSQ